MLPWGTFLTAFIAAEGTLASVPSLQAHTPYIGVQLEGVEEGVRLSSVYRDTPADQAGLKAGDIIVAVNGEKIDSVDTFITQIRSHRYGEVAVVTVRRGDRTLQGLVMVRGNQLTFQEERRHPFAAPVFGWVKGRWQVPEAVKHQPRQAAMVVTWSQAADEKIAMDWLRELEPLTSPSLTVVRGNGAWGGAEWLRPASGVWCYVVDQEGWVRGWLPYGHRDQLGELGRHLWGVTWEQDLGVGWLSRLGLGVKPGALGLMVSKVHPPGFQEGDVIKKVEGVSVHTIQELVQELKAYPRGVQVMLEILRNHTLHQITLSLND